MQFSDSKPEIESLLGPLLAQLVDKWGKISGLAVRFRDRNCDKILKIY